MVFVTGTVQALGKICSMTIKLSVYQAIIWKEKTKLFFVSFLSVNHFAASSYRMIVWAQKSDEVISNNGVWLLCPDSSNCLPSVNAANILLETVVFFSSTSSVEVQMRTTVNSPTYTIFPIASESCSNACLLKYTH